MSGASPRDGADSHVELLRSIVELTRAIFGAAACSITRHDVATQELVFEAVAGAGADTLVGRRIPARTGLAGWSLASEQPIAVGDVVSDPRFARDVAESTGYVPERLTVYPLLHDERVLGVISVLDPGLDAGVGLAEMDVLGQIATHAAAVLQLVIDARGGDGTDPHRRRLEGIGEALSGLDPAARQPAERLLTALEELLRRY